MKIPKYVQELMSRAAFDRVFFNPKSVPGYTIKIRKATPYSKVDTLKAECNRLVEWANRVCPTGFDDLPTALVLELPSKTHYCMQVAYVTIYDPLMKALEPYIADKN